MALPIEVGIWTGAWEHMPRRPATGIADLCVRALRPDRELPTAEWRELAAALP